MNRNRMIAKLIAVVLLAISSGCKCVTDALGMAHLE
jgi:hypothetical protein